MNRQRLYYLLTRNMTWIKLEKRQRFYYLFFKPFTPAFMQKFYKYGFYGLVALFMLGEIFKVWRM